METHTIVETHILDVKKLLCPLPVIRLQQKIQVLKPKDIVILYATDKGVLYDVPTWCKIHGHRIIEIVQTKEFIQIEIEIGFPLEKKSQENFIEV